jgi:THO complex subunit 4
MSRGIATVTFTRSDGASKAFSALNGILVDNRPIKIEIVVGGNKAAAIAPPAKSLTDRISQPKSQPKSAAPSKKKEAAAIDAAANGATRGGRPKRGRGGRNARPAKKTAEELDSEMADYFEGGTQPEAATGAPAANNGGDAPMEDEILVRICSF